jgi:hypothetical protein
MSLEIEKSNTIPNKQANKNEQFGEKEFGNETYLPAIKLRVALWKQRVGTSGARDRNSKRPKQ